MEQKHHTSPLIEIIYASLNRVQRKFMVCFQSDSKQAQKGGGEIALLLSEIDKEKVMFSELSPRCFPLRLF